MADVQKYFLEFHDAIKLSNIEENKILQEKRDILIGNLKEKLPEDFPSFSQFNQGSYAMNTGVNPKDSDFDIDVGIVFECLRSKFTPVGLKKKIRDALAYANRQVLIRRSCVTVQYIKSGEHCYHVDLAIYVKREEDSFFDLAKGKEFSEESEKYWELSDPKGLISKIQAGSTSCLEAKHTAQMRRCIRYLKLWRDHKLPSGKPVSIALTCAAQQWFSPKEDRLGKDDDLEAMLNWASQIHTFVSVTRNIPLPVQPYSNLLAELTENQLNGVCDRLVELKNALKEARAEDDPVEACKKLMKQFGKCFPVPEKSETAKVSIKAAVLPSGTSA
ncbi:cyclic GMP-AMP synthase DncV-like nucleotidyltransferase [Desulfovibrio sp. DV]|uniref:cyclic GMP-AMP synthase DncV-like nucleotidyltransferase n=1 Tax=Desulfovibrio sp. DV TaxID=1844708 RepID=UPI00094BBA76|nr:hypothetical protein [Desulfovibrio sp. DV]